VIMHLQSVAWPWQEQRVDPADGEVEGDSEVLMKIYADAISLPVIMSRHEYPGVKKDRYLI
jgi:hypothetical protein